MINRNEIKKLPAYGQSRFANGSAFVTFKIKANGQVDMIFWNLDGVELRVNDRVYGNTYECGDAVLVTKDVWADKIKALKQFIKSYRA